MSGSGGTGTGGTGAGGTGTGGVSGSGGAPAGGCGNGTVEAGEQCDDGNTAGLDGCDPNCKYEALFRIDQLALQSTAPSASWCNPNASTLGKALFGDDPTADINAGKLNDVLQVIGLDDPTGVTDSNVEIGTTYGVLDPAKGKWPNNGPIDWWFLLAKSTVDAAGLATARMPASLSVRALNANPGTATLLFDVASSIVTGAPVPPPARLDLVNANMRANFGTVTSPPGPPPAARSLPSNFQVVETLTGALCGNVTVESLSVIPVPEIFASGAAFPCSASCSGSHA